MRPTFDGDRAPSGGMFDAKNDDETDWVLIARYLAGEASPAEEAELRRWIAGGPGRQDEFAALRRLWDQAGALPSSSRVEAMWQAIAREIRASDEPAGARNRRAGVAVEARAAPPPAYRLLARRLREISRRPAARLIAASLAVAAAGVLAWRAYPSWHARIVAMADPGREYRTEHGQRAEIQLRDGTRVDLGPASKLRVRFSGEKGPREVHLEGEAVFDVVHDAKRPFRVHSANGVTEDLGTKFAVRAYPDDDRVQVVVVEGLVALRPSNAPQRSGTILGPGQLGRLDLAGKVVVTSGVDTAAYLAWTRGRLVLDQAPLREVARQLERWYGVAIEIPDPRVAEKRITLDIPLRALTEALNAVTVPLELRYERKADSIVIHP